MSEHFPVVSANSLEPTTVGQLMRPPTTIEQHAHLAAAAYLMKHFHDSALVVGIADTENLSR